MAMHCPVENKLINVLPTTAHTLTVQTPSGPDQEIISAALTERGVFAVMTVAGFPSPFTGLVPLAFAPAFG